MPNIRWTEQRINLSEVLIMEKYFVNLYLFDQTSMMISGIVMIERRVETVTSREV